MPTRSGKVWSGTGPRADGRHACSTGRSRSRPSTAPARPSSPGCATCSSRPPGRPTPRPGTTEAPTRTPRERASTGSLRCSTSRCPIDPLSAGRRPPGRSTLSATWMPAAVPSATTRSSASASTARPGSSRAACSAVQSSTSTTTRGRPSRRSAGRWRRSSRRARRRSTRRANRSGSPRWTTPPQWGRRASGSSGPAPAPTT